MLQQALVIQVERWDNGVLGYPCVSLILLRLVHHAELLRQAHPASSAALFARKQLSLPLQVQAAVDDVAELDGAHDARTHVDRAQQLIGLRYRLILNAVSMSWPVRDNALAGGKRYRVLSLVEVPPPNTPLDPVIRHQLVLQLRTEPALIPKR